MPYGAHPGRRGIVDQSVGSGMGDADGSTFCSAAKRVAGERLQGDEPEAVRVFGQARGRLFGAVLSLCITR
ncbi:hypothetical protein D3C75_1305910 [compost metagenome]